MTTIAAQPRALAQKEMTGDIVLEDVTWDYYMRTIEELMRTGQKVRVTYDDGRMELMAPISDEHEDVKKIIARLIELYALERDIPISGRGSVTMNQPKRKKGTEPDECYYVKTPKPKAKGKPLDTSKTAPPDLVIEVDIKSGSIAREPIYAAMGIRELWRYEGGRIQVMELGSQGEYREIMHSTAFPRLSMAEFAKFLKRALANEHAAVKAFRDWLRAHPEA